MLIVLVISVIVLRMEYDKYLIEQAAMKAAITSRGIFDTANFTYGSGFHYVGK